MTKLFYKKAIKDCYNNGALSRLLAHLMFNNFDFSKKRVFMVMESVNDANGLSDIKNVFDLLYFIFPINDNFTLVRLEWFMGIPQLVVKTNDSTFVNLQARNMKFGEKILKYISPILYGTYYDSLLERLITKYQSSCDFLVILNYFFAAIFRNGQVFHYFDSLPHPKKDLAYLKDYVFQLAEEELNRIVNITNMAHKYEKAIKGINRIMREYDQKRLDFKTDNLEKYRFKPNYAYGNIISEHINHYENEGINPHNMYCFIIDYDVEILNSEFNPIGAAQPMETISANSNNLINVKTAPKPATEATASLENTQVSQSDRNIYDDVRVVDVRDEDVLNNSDHNPNNVSMTALHGEEDLHQFEPIDISQSLNINRKIDEEEKKENEKPADEKVGSNLINNLNQTNSHENQQRIADISSNNNNNINQYKSNWLGNTGTSGFNNFCSTSEEVFFRRSLNTLLENETYSSTCDTRKSATNKLIVNCIKRCVIFNNSDKELKAKFTFFSKDEFVNCYMPISEIIIITKKNSVNNVFTFLKEDVSIPWNDISFTLDAEPYESSSNYDNRFNELSEDQKGIKKSRSLNDLKIGPEPKPNGGQTLG